MFIYLVLLLFYQQLTCTEEWKYHLFTDVVLFLSFFHFFFFFFTNSLHIQFLSDRNQAGMGICGVSTMLCLFQACFPSPSCGGSLLYGQYSVNEETRTFFLRTFDNNLEHVKTEDVGWKRKISDKRLACAEDDRKIMLCILRQ